eukprot:2713184-Amphidinium_carterae.1
MVCVLQTDTTTFPGSKRKSSCGTWRLPLARQRLHPRPHLRSLGLHHTPLPWGRLHKMNIWGFDSTGFVSSPMMATATLVDQGFCCSGMRAVFESRSS